MQMTYRAIKRNTPDKSDTLVSSREQAFQLIAKLDRKLAGKISRHERATYLCARAVLYEALGDRKMLNAAEEAFKFSKTAQSAALVAVALHHHGRIKEAIQYYEQSYRFPHEAGFEVDIGQQGGLLLQPKAETWLKAWEIVLQLKKRMVWAAHLPTWDGKPCAELQIISEGGYGDLIIGSRYLQRCTEVAEHVTIFLPQYFFDSGFVDLARQQPWWPETKILTECKPNLPSAGFFDLPAIFKTLPSTIPAAPRWITTKRNDFDPEFQLTGKPLVGFCHSARAMETPLVSDGTYRSLRQDQAQRIVNEVAGVNWVGLQVPDSPLDGIAKPPLESWVDTAAVIDQLDAVVTVDTAVAHLAASMGKPTHVLLSGAVDWKYGMDGDTCLWYPAMRLWRNGDWGFETAVSDIISALNEGSLP